MTGRGMQALAVTAVALFLALALLALAGCSTPAPTRPQPAMTTLQVPGGGMDVPDCDFDDLIEGDPDCGAKATPTRTRPTPAKSTPTRTAGDDRREPAPTETKPTKRGKR